MSKQKQEKPVTASLDLEQIHVFQAVFMECLIANDGQELVAPEQVAGFSEPAVVLLPFFNPERRLVTFDVQVHTQAHDSTGTTLPLTGSFRVYLAFQVANLPDLLHPHTLTPIPVPNPELSATLVGAAYSTVRGMIMSKVTDTVMGGFALPLRSIKRLMEDSNVVLRTQLGESGAARVKQPRKRKTSPPKASS